MYKLKKIKLRLREWNVEAFCFLPHNNQTPFETIALFTHGYTAHKGTLLNWGVQLANKNIPTIIFDLPGHYLGSFNEVNSMEEFDQFVHLLFESALVEFEKFYPTRQTENIILGGHSLGALLSLRAATLDSFQRFNRYILPIGHGLRAKGSKHPLLGDFFKPLLDIRSELVSPSIAPHIILSWIERSKPQLNVENCIIHFITGEDDLLVTVDDCKRYVNVLKKNNTVSYEIPTHLPHHQPELAIKFILRFLKTSGLFPKV